MADLVKESMMRLAQSASPLPCDLIKIEVQFKMEHSNQIPIDLLQVLLSHWIVRNQPGWPPSPCCFEFGIVQVFLQLVLGTFDF